MRRTMLALFALMLVGVFVTPQAQTAAVRFRSQADQDAAIARLRGALSVKPDDQALKNELTELLVLKQRALRSQIDELTREIASLRPAAAGALAGCGGPVSAPVRLGGNVGPPLKTYDVKPAYPADALAAKLEGIVIIEATIDCNGNVADAQLLRGVPLLNDVAMDAVRQWKYTPTLLNGVPVPVKMTVTVTFAVR